MICVHSMKYSDLDYWVKNKAKPGDLAFYYVNNGEFGEFMYTYYYTKPDDNPRWCMWSDMKKLQKYLDSLGEPKMENRCDNCKHFKSMPGSFSWCSHKEHAGAMVPTFTTCADHEPKEERQGPFDNIKLRCTNPATGDISISYICEDCGKVMDKPFYWLIRFPVGPNKKPTRPGYYFYCEDCNKKINIVKTVIKK